MKKFSKDAKIFLCIQTLFTLSTALSSTFVNIYLWRLTSDLRYIGLYNIVNFLFIPLTFILSGYISRKKDIIACSRLGIIGYLMFYLIIIVMQNNVKNYIIPLGALYGCGMGFYCFGNNTLIYHFTEDNNRGYYLGLSGALGSIMGTIAPIISGWVIVTKSTLKGYYIVFGMSFILFAASIALSYFLSQQKMEGKSELKRLLFTKNKAWRKILVSNFMMGLRDGALGYIVSILIFLVFKNELNMGQFTTVTSVLGIVSTFFIGRFYRKRIGNQLFFIGAILCFIGTVVLVIWTNYIGVMINGILTSVFTCFWNIPFGTMSYEIAGKSSAKSHNLGDYMIAREIPLAFGRILGITIYIVLSMNFMDQTAIKILLPILSSMIVINYLYLRIKR